MLAVVLLVNAAIGVISLFLAFSTVSLGFSIGENTSYSGAVDNFTLFAFGHDLQASSNGFSVSYNDDETLTIFSIGSDKFVYYRNFFENGSAIGKWESLGTRAAFVTSLHTKQGNLNIFLRGPDSVPYYKQQFSNGTWSPDWKSLGGRSKYLASANDKDGASILFSVSKDNAVYYSHLGDEWKPLLSVGKSSQAAVLSAPNNAIHLFTISLGYGQLFYYELENEPLPQLNDNTNLRVELVAGGLSSPTSMAFLDPENLLILEKNTGNIRRLTNGSLINEPVMQFGVSTLGERGLLGISIDDHPGSTPRQVYIYLTELNNTDSTARNKLYRYTWENEKLVNPKVLLDLPSDFQNHNGGKIVMSDSAGLYTVIGDQNKSGILQNNLTGAFINNTGVIFRIDEEGDAMTQNPFSNMSDPFDKYFAYGLRNSFGMAIDPVNDNLWDSENGDLEYDELNLVLPGLNSGWSKVMGPIGRTNETIDNLTNLNGSHYSDPLFSWRYPIGVTDIEFLNSTRLGSKYQNNLFVGDIHKGNLYHFDLADNRSTFIFSSNQTELYDHVADTEAESKSIILGTRFGGITDISTGPDGYLYVLTITGHLYRISYDSD